MSSNIEFQAENIYNDLYAIFVRYQKCLFQFYHTLCPELNKVNIQATLEFENLKPKINRSEMKCIIFGETSSGKSTLINALLNGEILPSRYGRTTNCFIEIKQSSLEKSYILIDKKEEDFDNLKMRINFKSKSHLPDGSHVDVFYKNESCCFLTENVVIIDTPGIDTDVAMDQKIEKYCTNADVIVLIVNSTSSITNTMKGFITRFQTKFSKLNCFLVFNHWDLPDDEEDREDTLNQFKADASELLCNQLHYSPDLAGQRIFFLSAWEQIMMLRNDSELKRKSRWRERNEMFLNFTNRLKTEMEENVYKRKGQYLNTLYSVIKQYISSRFAVKNYNEEQISTVTEEHIKELDTDEIIGIYIETNIKEMISSCYEEFLIESLNLYDLDTYVVTDEQRQLMKNRIYEKCMIIIDKAKQNMYSKINDFLKENGYEKSDLFNDVLVNAYFPLYVDVITSLFKPDFIEPLAQMKRKINIAQACSRGIRTVAGIVAGLIKIIPLSRPLIEKCENLPNIFYRYICKSNEIIIQTEWKKMEEKLNLSFPIFVKEMKVFIEIKKQLEIVKKNLQIYLDSNLS